MTHGEVASAALDWAHEVLSDDLRSGYAFISDAKGDPDRLAFGTGELPDAMVEVTSSRVVWRDERFPVQHLQNGPLHVFELTVSFMVDNGDPKAGAATLRDFADRLGVALLGSTTMSGRVMFASPLIRFDFARPFVEYDDGTRGREMTLDVAVAEIVDAEV